MMKMQSSNAGGISLCVMTIMPTLIHASSDFVYIKTAMSLKDTRIIPIEFWNLFKKKYDLVDAIIFDGISMFQYE